MSPIAAPLARLAEEIAASSAALGRRVDVDLPALTDRSADMALAEPGLRSPNRSCRLVRAADGWIAVNLPRTDDKELVPAWLGLEQVASPWRAVVAAGRRRSWRSLADGARTLGLPVAGVGEIRRRTMDALLAPLGRPAGAPLQPRKAVDLSSLWAGPLCGALLAAFGLSVTKVESPGRPDPSRASTPVFFRRLNGAKAELALDFASADGRARLRELMLDADVVITSARPRAFEQLGLSPADLFAARPELVWVAISGYGWMSGMADRVAFGDDAAAAGGLVEWTGHGPRFLGDALADPLTGLAAAAGVLKALQRGGGVLVDAALAGTAAGAAAALDARNAA
jgi:hypothetical protein